MHNSLVKNNNKNKTAIIIMVMINNMCKEKIASKRKKTRH